MAKYRIADRPLRNRVAAHLRKALSDRGWSQRELGKALGTNGGMISRLVNAERTMGLDTFAKMHTKLGLDANTLIDEDPPAEFFSPNNPDVGAAAELRAIARAKDVPPDVAKRLEGVIDKLKQRGGRKKKG